MGIGDCKVSNNFIIRRRATREKSFKYSISFIFVFCRPYGANIIIYHLLQGLRLERTGHAVKRTGHALSLQLSVVISEISEVSENSEVSGWVRILDFWERWEKREKLSVFQLSVISFQLSVLAALAVLDALDVCIVLKKVDSGKVNNMLIQKEITGNWSRVLVVCIEWCGARCPTHFRSDYGLKGRRPCCLRRQIYQFFLTCHCICCNKASIASSVCRSSDVPGRA